MKDQEDAESEPVPKVLRIAPCCKETVAAAEEHPVNSSIAGTSDSAPGTPKVVYRPEAGIHAVRANVRLKLATGLVQKANQRLKTVTEERDTAVKLLRESLKLTKATQEKTSFDIRRAEESFREMRETELGYLKNIKGRFVEEKTMLNKLISAFQTNQHNLISQYKHKKEELSGLKKAIDIEVEYQDACKKQVSIFKRRNEQLEMQMQDKLYLGTHSTCGNCEARKRVAAALENQIVRKAGENDELKKQKEEADKRVAEKDRIAQILLKENERLRFELKQTKLEAERMLQQSRNEETLKMEEFDELWKQKLEESLQAVAAQTPGPCKTPSPPTSEPDSSLASAGEGKAPPVYGANPFAAWAKGPKTPSDASPIPPFNAQQSRSGYSVPKRATSESGGETPRGDGVAVKSNNGGANLATKEKPKTPENEQIKGAVTPKPEFSAPEPKKRKIAKNANSSSAGNEDSVCPPPPPAPPTSEMEVISEEKGEIEEADADCEDGEYDEEKGEIEEADADCEDGEYDEGSLEDEDVVTDDNKFASRDWLQNQLEGMENLTAWYRKQLKNMTDDLLYFQGRLEEDTETIEKQAALVRKKEIDYRQIRRDLERSKMHEEMLRGQLSNLASSVSTYFGT